MIPSDKAGLQPTDARSSLSDLPTVDAPPIHYAAFDIETRLGADEVKGGWDGMRLGLGDFACGAIYDSEQDWTFLYGPEDLDAFAAHLESAATLVSYNGIGFDVPAIEGTLRRPLKLEPANHLDLLAVLVQAAGNRKGLTLENVSRHTLGRGKIGHGAHAPQLYREALQGGIAGLTTTTRLLTYCAHDVRLTRDLLRFLSRNQMLLGPNGPIYPTLPNWFVRLV